MHSCKSCVSACDADTLYELVRLESEKYLESISVQQTWTGTEPAFQFLLLPDKHSPELPKYAETPVFLDPCHCRLCLQPCGEMGLETHLRDEHDLSLQDYRQRILRRTVA